MNTPFEGKLLVSDIDGTLVYGGTHLPQRNVDAIERFQRGGGVFALATGRAWQSAVLLLDRLKPKGPCIFVNGACLYDWTARRFAAEAFLDPAADDFLRALFLRFPGTAAEIFTRDELMVLRENRYTAYHRRVVVAPERRIAPDALPAQKYKVLLMDDAPVIDEMRLWFEENAPRQVSAFRSCAEYFEIMPRGVDKGSGLCRLRELLGIRAEDTYAIGDYENDLAMLSQAGVSAAPSSGDEEVRKSVQLVVGDCAGGAVADLVEIIEKA